MRSVRGVGVLSLVNVAVLTACASVQEQVRAVPPPAEVVAVPELSAAARLDLAVADLEDGRLSQAKEVLAKLAEELPKGVAVQFDLGLALERLGMLADAEVHLEVAHRLDANHKPTLLNLGYVYRLQEKFAEAIALYEAALQLPALENDVDLNNNLTVLYRLAKQYPQAEATARKVLMRTKDNADAYKNLGLIYFDQGRYRLAEFIFGNARRLDDKDPGVYNNLGLISLKLDDNRVALAQFQRALALNADFVPALFNVGALALSYRDYSAAERVLGRVTQLTPNSHEGWLGYAWALEGQKVRDAQKGLAAGQAFERALALRGSHDADAICGAGWAYAQDKAVWEKALTFLEKCRSAASTSPSDRQLIDSKIKSIAALQRSGQEAPPRDEQKEKARASPAAGGPSMVDKVASEAAEKVVPSERADPGENAGATSKAADGEGPGGAKPPGPAR
jgi:tetratricopeptide (TPR) repeat protein